MKSVNSDAPCPCFSGKAFKDCCTPYLSSLQSAPTALALMRSRYAAFATGAMDYLETTLLPSKRADFNRASAEAWSRDSEWTGLDILDIKAGGETDKEGFVTFAAHYRQNGRDFRHCENSHFERHEGRWHYVDAVKENPSINNRKTNRNDPCPCGSGKKYKKCCGAN